ncbi:MULTISPECIES: DUF6629 family protein [unclassified Streptomyces]|uniref:DUF6629 family protein n=1 Tax=unclassified Streptomyces TaxID=2593676 RepID=UPI001BE6628F|nr:MULTISPECIES: DUF6629 family protein [unclassified Streptomyces]MBT2405132.1 hypothetical protein [Streptomyces sp. ISL-21]MBT2459562.1 hypothetical protein [Streptomyces sp. ISL-86]MBT2610900.1 hypothetical protein [Streptomyces sp. ISL-87]
MCWSATADLTAGTVITAVGVVCVLRVRRARDLPVAALPLLLGAHQLVEAAVWRSGGGCGPATTAWAVIALPVLPVWVPLGVLLAAAPDARRRLWGPVAVGLAAAAVLAYCLAIRPATAELRGRTIGYVVDVPYVPLVLAGYLFATLGALLLAGGRRLRLLGAVLAAGALLCAALWRLEFASTWCAFAAVASVLVLGWVRRGTDPAAAAAVTGSWRPARRAGRRRTRRGGRRTGRRSAG